MKRRLGISGRNVIIKVVTHWVSGLDPQRRKWGESWAKSESWLFWLSFDHDRFDSVPLPTPYPVSLYPFLFFGIIERSRDDSVDPISHRGNYKGNPSEAISLPNQIQEFQPLAKKSDSAFPLFPISPAPTAPSQEKSSPKPPFRSTGRNNWPSETKLCFWQLSPSSSLSLLHNGSMPISGRGNTQIPVPENGKSGTSLVVSHQEPTGAKGRNGAQTLRTEPIKLPFAEMQKWNSGFLNVKKFNKSISLSGWKPNGQPSES